MPPPAKPRTTKAMDGRKRWCCCPGSSGSWTHFTSGNRQLPLQQNKFVSAWSSPIKQRGYEVPHPESWIERSICLKKVRYQSRSLRRSTLSSMQPPGQSRRTALGRGSYWKRRHRGKVASHYRYRGAFHVCGEMRGTSVYDPSTGKADPVQSRAGYPHIKLLRCTACQQKSTIRPLLTVE